jgi:hypothetical protein
MNMSQCLHPCPSCAQHLRSTETVCPFCDAALPEGFGVCARSAGAQGRPMSRAALLFVGATVAASCGGSTESGFVSDGGREGSTDSGDGDLDGPVALYAPSPVDAGPRPDAATDAPTDAQPGWDGPAVLYGPAMIDSGDKG